MDHRHTEDIGKDLVAEDFKTKKNIRNRGWSIYN